MLQVKVQARKRHAVDGLVRSAFDDAGVSAFEPLLKAEAVRSQEVVTEFG